jgi:hypothetical protein
LTYDDVKHFRKNETLEKELDRVEKIQKRWAERQPKPEGEKEPKKVAAQVAEPDYDKMVADGFDPEAVAAIKAGNDRAKLLEAKLGELTEHYEQDRLQRAIDARQSRFETILEALEPDYPEMFGKGEGAKLNNKEQFQNRAEVWETYNALETGYHNSGMKIPSADVLIRKAAAAAFSERTKQQARTKLKADIKKAGSQTLTRSKGSSGAAAPDGRQAVVDDTAEFLRKNQ